MKDLTQTKDHLAKALQDLPGDFALQEVRYHIRAALQKLEHTEKKRSSRESKQKTHHQTWNEMLANGVQNPYTPKRTIDIINQMIDEERRKLEEIQARKAKVIKEPDEGGLDTLFD